jgi:hypothetical protein
MIMVFAKITSNGADHIALFAKQSEIIRNIPCSAAEIFAELFDREADIDAVELIRQNVVGKIARKIHDAIVRERSGYQYFGHACNTNPFYKNKNERVWVEILH